MRILVSAWNRGLVGGTETYLQALLPGLLERGHELALLYFQEAGERESVDPPEAPITRISLAAEGEAEARRAIADFRPDVLYLHGLHAPELEAWLVETYPAALFAHGYYGTCATGRKSHALPALRPCRRTFGPACLALHYPRRCGGLNPLVAWRSYRIQRQRHDLLPGYRAVLVASRHMRREMARHGVAAERLHRLPLPMPADLLALPRPQPRPPRGRIAFVGRLTDLKGVGLLLAALPVAQRELGRPLQLIVAGTGPSRADLMATARRLGLDADFPGWVSSEERAKLLQEADLLAVPSAWPEPFGLSGPEAGLFGLPAVAFDVGGISDWLLPGETGELAPGDPPTAEGLAAAIARALADPEHHARLSRGAWAKARSYDLATHVRGLETLLEGIAGGRA